MMNPVHFREDYQKIFPILQSHKITSLVKTDKSTCTHPCNCSEKLECYSQFQ